MSVRTTRITIETETLTIVRGAHVDVGWCPQCRGEVDVIRVGEKGAVDAASAAQVEIWRNLNGLHVWDGPGTLMQICVRSLMRCLERGHADADWQGSVTQKGE